MIRYALACGEGHRFDSWFRDSDAFEDQAARRLVACPLCGSPQVDKAIMAPAVVGGARLPEQSAAGPPAASDERARDIRKLLRAVRDRVVAEGHDVGRDFALEARRIHDGTAPDRQIYGQASLDEARDLIDDGIRILPLPIVPDELN